MNKDGTTVVLDEDGILQTDTIQEADNVDSNNPLKLKFYIDDDTIRIDKINLNFSLEEFRAYSRGTKSGGGTTQTSSSGGGVSKSTESGGGVVRSTSNGGGSQTTTSTYFQGDNFITTEPVVDDYDIHWHRIPNNRINHSHSVTIPSHSHTFEVPSHTHSISIPNHTHSVTIPNHTHGIEYGIYTSTKATGVKIKVNGQTVDDSGYTSDQSNIDLTQYIREKGWNTIELTSTRLGRINASLYIKSFIGV